MVFLGSARPEGVETGEKRSRGMHSMAVRRDEEHRSAANESVTLEIKNGFAFGTGFRRR